MIADPATPAETRAFLRMAAEIRAFATGPLGLRDNGSYTTYRAVESDHLVDVVSACDATSFTPHLWRYLFVGRLPYQGFYRAADANREAARLAADGYDVIVRPVDAFSSLGIAKDPLYSFMSDDPPHQLASIIIHELTHATLFLKDQPDFDEAFATFVAEEGAMEWVRRKFGGESAEYAAAVAAAADADTMEALLRGLAAELDAVYRGGGSREQKLARKAELIFAFTTRLAAERGTIFRSPAYRAANLDVRINNALLSQFLLYHDGVPLLREYWERMCNSDLRRFMSSVRELAQRGDVLQAVREILAAGTNDG